MSKQTWLKIIGALAVTALATLAIAADHQDSPSVTSDPPADINDVYSFVDNGKVVLAMTVFPAAASGSKFSDAVQYVFHTTSTMQFGQPGPTLDVVCMFDAAQKITCLAGEGPGQPAIDKVTGDASVIAGLEGTNKLMKVYAGLRKDAFFFNAVGFQETAKTIVNAAPSLMFDAAGCPMIDTSISQVLINQLQSNAQGASPDDFFQALNSLVIVVSLDKAMVTTGGPIVSVWGSTNKASGN